LTPRRSIRVHGVARRPHRVQKVFGDLYCRDLIWDFDGEE
jgi:hypothetical protein